VKVLLAEIARASLFDDVALDDHDILGAVHIDHGKLR
jgi:hypothetical protein